MNAPGRWTQADIAIETALRALRAAPDADKLAVLGEQTTYLAGIARDGYLDAQEIGDVMTEAATANGLMIEPGADEVQRIINTALDEAAPLHVNGADAPPEIIPPALSPDEFGHTRSIVTLPSVDWTGIPLTIGDWLGRELPPPDKLMGHWLTTTSRVILNAPTGIGKTNLGLGIATHAGAGIDFLHWHAHRPARVLFVDGEMSRRLLVARIQDAVRRAGCAPEGLHVLSHEDIPNFQPLNTPIGQAMILQAIATVGGVDAVVFDNIMSLVAGDMKDEEGWRQTDPLRSALTRRGIGQLWVHHTGHDTSHGYGTKTREWGMDTVIHLTEAKREDTDVSFTLEFRKARERTPDTRADFADVTIALVNDAWECSAGATRQSSPSPIGAKFLEALNGAIAASSERFAGQPAAKMDAWRAECLTRGLLNRDKPDSVRSLHSKHRRELIACNLIACNDDLAWRTRR